ncbi:MAG: RagB/SusD family nutrient uptake outer membrane protein [Gemmatimonas sp.]
MLLLTCGVIELAACNDPLAVSRPGTVTPDNLSDPAAATLLVNSTISAFECAHTQYVMLSANFTDEMIASHSAEVFFTYDQRPQSLPDFQAYGSGGCANNGSLYVPLSQARFLADDSFRRLSAWTDAQVSDRPLKLATVAAYAGYAYTEFAEGFCSAAFDLGPEVLPPAMLALAEERFSAALQWAEAAGNSAAANSIASMARVGRARVRLNRGNAAGALQDAALVPAGYVRNAARAQGDATLQNKLFTLNAQSAYMSVDTAFQNVRFAGVGDTRVSVVNAGRRGGDGLTPLFIASKYASVSAPIPIARAEEAQLIIAELSGGQTAVGIINSLHAKAGIPAFSSSDATTITAQTREERRREFFLEGHRLNDMRRFRISLPSGAHPYTGIPYGTADCWPVPTVEIANNPNFRK